MSSLDHQLRQLQRIRWSLKPGEVFSFILPSEDATFWSSLLDAFDNDVDGEIELLVDRASPCAARFSVRVPGSPVWFEVQVPEGPTIGYSDVFVKGENVSRDQQEYWQSIIAESAALDEVQISKFPIYTLISEHLLPTLREYNDNTHAPTGPPSEIPACQPEKFHAYLASHHLYTPSKLNDMRRWSSELHIAGRVKVGKSGRIYAEGEKSKIEKFISNVKTLHLEKLKVIFVERVEPVCAQAPDIGNKWMEVEKHSEIVEYMKKLGRESCMNKYGIGSGSK
ncbi:hypothetical protein EDC04DRAFT_242418 [Pisolithus marmoratus]|nr:hypothetical protein EDC04DRAFT_242418 [Pisolithus marmoratus]